MLQTTFDVQVITPLFLAGADQGDAELRAPSFRGAMRYWLRALLGGIYGTDRQGLENVAKAEANVFGATDRGSAVQVRMVSNQEELPVKQFTDNIGRGQGSRQSTGKGYLLWSMRLKQPPRYYILPGTNLQICLSAHGADSTNLQRGIAAFWLLTCLGGVGSRSRRCAGSLSIKAIQGDTYTFPFNVPENAQALKAQIERGIRIARALYETPRSNRQQALFDVITPGSCRIWILQKEQPWRTAEEALEAIGDSYQSYRGTLSLAQRKVFGFPLRGISGSVDRRSSPLLLRITELQGNTFVGVAVLFKTPNADISMKDYEYIENWISARFSLSTKLEVQL